MKRLMLLLLVCAFCRCSLSQSRTVTVTMPDVGETLFPEGVYRFSLSWSSGGESRSIGGLKNGESVRVDLLAGEIVAFLADCSGVSMPEMEFEPAGGIYPDDLNGGTIRLEWRRGALASLLISGETGLSLNRERVQSEMEERAHRGGDGRADVWSIDLELLKTQIAARKMRWYYVKKLRMVEVSGLPAGRWHTGNPFLSPFVIDETDNTVELCLGRHWLRRPADESGGELIYIAEVGERETLLFPVFSGG